MKELTAYVIAAALALGAPAMAQSGMASHGGIVQSSGSLSFELVYRNGQATVYVDDRGKDLQTAGASGKLTVFRGTQKNSVRLEPDGENTLVSKGNVQLAPGAKAIVSISLPGKQEVNVRFSIR